MSLRHFSSRPFQLLLVASCLVIVGCVDSVETVLRDRLALATEKVDLLMHVVDQQSAKTYTKGWGPRMDRRLSELDERQRKVEDNMDKKDHKEWMEREKLIKAKIAQKEYPKDSDRELLGKFYFNYAKERVACELALGREAVRLQNVVSELTTKGAEASEVMGVLAVMAAPVKK